MKHHHESFTYLEHLFESTPVTELGSQQRYVIFSDFHMGNRGRNDDFASNAGLVLASLRYYLEKGYALILNGDIEELLRFGLDEIRRSWPEIFEVFDDFQNGPGLIKIIGNHDLELLDATKYPYPLRDAIKFLYKGNYLFIYHGHQTMRRYREYNPYIHYALKYLANPLNIKNYSVSHDSLKRFKTEKRVYQFSSEKKILSIIGHTHRPLFESMSRTDTIRFEIERLCRKFPKATEEKQATLEKRILNLRSDLANILENEDRFEVRKSLYDANLVVPCIFNSGTVIGKRGVTCLEIDQGDIALRHWFDETVTQKYLGGGSKEPKQLPGTTFYRVKMKADSLDYIFARIRLLGGSALSG